MMLRSLARALGLLAVVVLCLVGFAPEALAYVPPAPQGAVTDTSGKLSAADDSVLEEHIAAYRARTTNELAVLVVGSLGAESVDDVAYTTFNTWGVGKKGPDNGVLLVIAPSERKMRIETGKGVGDRLTDLESSHILRQKVGPLLAQERFREAILAGLTGIEEALDSGGPAAKAKASPSGSARPAQSTSVVALLLPILVLGFCAVVVIGILYLIVVNWRRGGGGGGGSSSSSSWSSSDSSSSSYSSGSSDWSSGDSGSSGSSGGSDFGGGSSGGGGSSDSY
jgi:uncharacterized protein